MMRSVLLIAALAGASAAKVAKHPVVPATVTPAPTAAPTSAPTFAPFFVPENERCQQTVIPPGVKPGACLENMCVPTALSNGDTFHTTIRWCLQVPRVHHIAFNVLNIHTKQYYGGTGFDYFSESQCGEHTFELTMTAADAPGGKIAPDSLMWKFFINPIWGNGTADGTGWVVDHFPNMISECGVPIQPTYNQPLANDCAVVPDRTWNLPKTHPEDRVFYLAAPLACLAPGKPWKISVATHLESRPQADFRVNLQLGTGNDNYLGPADVYINEVDFFNITANPEPRDGPNYWTSHDVTFAAVDTAKITPTDKPYVAAFMVPAGAQYNAALPTGWHLLDREFYLPVTFC